MSHHNFFKIKKKKYFQNTLTNTFFFFGIFEFLNFLWPKHLEGNPKILWSFKLAKDIDKK
jgi:hypothetical protein